MPPAAAAELAAEEKHSPLITQDLVNSDLKKKNLFLFDYYFKTIHSYTLSMSHISNQNNTNIKVIANTVIMHIINITTYGHVTPLRPG